ncbi:MAG TPA: efflux RND transporter periplasmic adaptor subunit [Caulobacteraceae bacterium]|jgi:Cu(I)/Ag(I) efflux system membrane fusion protein|nr:efflux RND transporter periplasmic adaptor subunit [Caulobacteraceae bacterium]
MNPITLTPQRLALAAAAVAAVAGATGYGIAHLGKAKPAPSVASSSTGRKVLYWYDPMRADQHFDKPGKSPFMDMQLMPMYAGEGGGAPGVVVSGATQESLGMRLASVQRSSFSQSLDATGVLDFNQRNVAIIQSRAPGFVERVYARAPGDVVRAGAPIADLLVPTWGGSQQEYLAVRATGDPTLEAAARQRLRLLGMSDSLIDEVTRTGRTHDVVTITTPIGGAIQSLDVRQGMSVNMGQSLAQVASLSTVWLNAAVPEAEGGQARVGDAARAEFAAFPSETFAGRVTDILPTAQADSRTLTLRIELPNRGGRLRPGMFATAHILGTARSSLVIPSEAVIRTGTRAIVMAAGEDGRFQPVEIKTGEEQGGRTEILAGLSEGQKVVASGQFLIDSEASLQGLQVRSLTAAGANQ